MSLLSFKNVILLRMVFIVMALVFCDTPALAVQDGKFGVGAGYFSHNALFTTTNDASGETSLIGNGYFPLTFRYDWKFGMEWFFSPRLLWTPIRDSGPDDVETSLLLLDLTVGQSLFSSMEWDWTAGVAYFQYKIEGAGGLVTLNNGTGTATFARPARTETTEQLLWSIGASRSLSFGDLLLNLYVTDPIGEKRSISGLVSLQYHLGGGGY